MFMECSWKFVYFKCLQVLAATDTWQLFGAELLNADSTQEYLLMKSHQTIRAFPIVFFQAEGLGKLKPTSHSASITFSFTTFCPVKCPTQLLQDSSCSLNISTI